MGLPFSGSSRLNEGLIAYFAMDDDAPNNAVADSKYGFNAYMDSANTEDNSVAGLNGKAMHFTRASSEYATISGKLGQYFDYGIPFTVSIIFKLDVLLNYQILLGNDCLSGDGYGIYVNSSGAVLAIFRRTAVPGYFGSSAGTVSSGTLYHLVLTYDGGAIASSFNAYSQNVLVGGGLVSGVPHSSPNDDFWIGGKQTTTDGFTDGSIQHIGIWDHVLDSVARDQLWDNGNILTYGNKPVSRGFSEYPSLGHKLIAEWNLDDNAATTETADSLERLDGLCSTNTNNLYDSAAPAEFAGSYDFSGTTDSVDVVNEVGKYIGKDNKLSIETWFWYDGSANVGVLGSGTSAKGISIQCAGGDAYAYVSDGLGVFLYKRANGILVIGLNHIIVTYDGNGALDGWSGSELYVNTIKGAIYIGAPPLALDFIPTSLHIGKYSSPTKYINNKQSTTRFWAKELNENEVSYLYNSGLGRQRIHSHFGTGNDDLADDLLAVYHLDDDNADTSIKDAHSSYNGACTVNTDTLSTTGFFRSCLDFDGAVSSNYILIPNLGLEIEIGKSFSIAFWIDFNTLGSQMAVGNSQYGNDGLWIGFVGSKIDFKLYDATSSFAALGATSLTTGSFAFVVVTYDGTNEAGMEVYLAGVNDTTSQAVVGSPTVSTDSNMYIGGHATSFPIDAKIDEVMFWSRTLTPSDVARLYNSGTGRVY